MTDGVEGREGGSYKESEERGLVGQVYDKSEIMNAFCKHINRGFG
jgi:hypothetical protein